MPTDREPFIKIRSLLAVVFGRPRSRSLLQGDLPHPGGGEHQLQPMALPQFIEITPHPQRLFIHGEVRSVFGQRREPAVAQRLSLRALRQLAKIDR